MNKKLMQELPVSIYIKNVTPTGQYYLVIKRTVDFDGKPFKNGIRWSPAFIAVEITEKECDKLASEMGVPRIAGITF